MPSAGRPPGNLCATPVLANERRLNSGARPGGSSRNCSQCGRQRQAKRSGGRGCFGAQKCTNHVVLLFVPSLFVSDRLASSRLLVCVCVRNSIKTLSRSSPAQRRQVLPLLSFLRAPIYRRRHSQQSAAAASLISSAASAHAPGRDLAASVRRNQIKRVATSATLSQSGEHAADRAAADAKRPARNIGARVARAAPIASRATRRAPPPIAREICSGRSAGARPEGAPARWVLLAGGGGRCAISAATRCARRRRLVRFSAGGRLATAARKRQRRRRRDRKRAAASSRRR